MNTPVSIPESDRLRYRLMNQGDAQLIFELDQDPEVMEFLNDGKPTSWDEITRYFMPRVAKFTDPATGCGLWEVTDRDGSEYLGWILVRQYGANTSYREADNIELGWRLKRHCWGKGIATEAAQAIIDVLKHKPQIRVFSAIADEKNLGSIGVMKKLGMQFVGNRVHQTPLQKLPVAYYEMPAR